MRAKALLGAIVALAAFASAPTAIAGRSLAPKPLLVRANGAVVRTLAYTYCTTGRPHNGAAAGICADGIIDRPHRQLPVFAGDAVYLRFRHNPAIRDRVENLQVALIRVEDNHRVHYLGGDVRERPVPDHPRRWHVELPTDLRGANALDVSVRYNGGDADFAPGIRELPSP